MGRSVKKGPFVAPELIKRVNELNKTGEKRVLKTCTTAESMCLCMSQKTWSAISWANLPPPAPIAATRAAKRPIMVSKP